MTRFRAAGEGCLGTTDGRCLSAVITSSVEILGFFFFTFQMLTVGLHHIVTARSFPVVGAHIGFKPCVAHEHGVISYLGTRETKTGIWGALNVENNDEFCRLNK